MAPAGSWPPRARWVLPAEFRPPASQGSRETIIGRSSSLTASVSHHGSALTPTSPLIASAGTGKTPTDALPSRTPRSTPLSVRAVSNGVSAPKWTRARSGKRLSSLGSSTVNTDTAKPPSAKRVADMISDQIRTMTGKGKGPSWRAFSRLRIAASRAGRSSAPVAPRARLVSLMRLASAMRRISRSWIVSSISSISSRMAASGDSSGEGLFMAWLTWLRGWRVLVHERGKIKENIDFRVQIATV